MDKREKVRFLMGVSGQERRKKECVFVCVYSVFPL